MMWSRTFMPLWHVFVPESLIFISVKVNIAFSFCSFRKPFWIPSFMPSHARNIYIIVTYTRYGNATTLCKMLYKLKLNKAHQESTWSTFWQFCSRGQKNHQVTESRNAHTEPVKAGGCDTESEWRRWMNSGLFSSFVAQVWLSVQSCAGSWGRRRGLGRSPGQRSLCSTTSVLVERWSSLSTGWASLKKQGMFKAKICCGLS